jgi:hypothetical protein
MKYLTLSIITLLFFAGCEPPEVEKIEEKDPILKLAYNSEYLYPAGFYHETGLDADGHAYYVNTVSIKPLKERKHIWIELSTNDSTEALLWSNLTDDYSSDHSNIISERETEKFFEFKRKGIDRDNEFYLSRVHKTSYFMPILDKFTHSDTIGIFNGELSEERVKELIEYLWDCGTLGIYSSKVIESNIKDYEEYFGQFIKSLIIVYGDFNLHDEVFVYNNYLKLNKTDRILTHKSICVDTIQGRQR